MYRVNINKFMNQIVWFLYQVQIWSREDEDTVWERRIKFFYSIYYSLFPVSLLTGALSSDNRGDMIFLIESSLLATTMLAKLLFLIWKKTNIIELMNQMCIYFIEDHNTFTSVNKKIQNLMKFVMTLLGAIILVGFCIVLVLPFAGSERTLFFNIGFPLDWRNNALAYWAAFIFIFTQVIISVIGFLFSVFIWYLMFHCGLRYVVLGEQIQNLGARKSFKEPSKDIERKPTDAEIDKVFRQDLHEAIARHQHLIELTNQFYRLPAKVFAIQLVTSGLSICGAVYRLAFDRGETIIEMIVNIVYLLHNVFDIFMICYFGNEIKLKSNRLSYCLFESQWMDRSQLIKKEILIFGELLMKPVELVVVKLYPLSLETFTRIINSAYSMFNIAKSFK